MCTYEYAVCIQSQIYFMFQVRVQIRFGAEPVGPTLSKFACLHYYKV